MEWYGENSTTATLAYFQKEVSNGFDNRALCPSSINDIASLSGADVANMFDSNGSDLYAVDYGQVEMTGPGFRNQAIGFFETYGYATNGNDQVEVTDSPGDDLYRTYPDRVIMSGADF